MNGRMKKTGQRTKGTAKENSKTEGPKERQERIKTEIQGNKGSKEDKRRRESV